MPVFRIEGNVVRQLVHRPFASEKELQQFFEANLVELLDVRFVATEFSTGERHGGRIDTLGLDLAGNPVIVEYKWDKSKNVVNQGLYYLDWLSDHRGDFELAVQKKLGAEPTTSWDAPRLILVASAYEKYDIYAINQLGARVELLRYRRHGEDTFVLESVGEPLSAKATAKASGSETTSSSSEYGLDYHRAKTTDGPWEAFLELRAGLLALDGVEERANQKSTISYRATKSFAALDFKRNSVMCQFKGGETVADPERRVKDIRSYQWGYPWAVDLKTSTDVEYVFALLSAAYEHES